MIARSRAALRALRPQRPSPQALLEVFWAVLIGLAGALLFRLLDLPLPWMLGPLFATTVASMAHLPVAIPTALRNPMSTVMGVLLGSSFTTEVLAGVGLWLPSLLSLPVYVVLVTVAAIFYLRKVARLDPRTAYFSATPGGLAEMIILGDRMGGDIRTISLIHATRILVVVFTVPFTVGFIEGVDPSGLPATGRAALTATDLLVMAACAVLGGIAGRLARLPAPLLIGPMIASAIAHMLELVHGAPPAALVAGAQLLIGASVGCRFRGIDLLRALQAMLVSLGLTAIMLGLATAAALLLAGLTGLPVTQLVLALSPGGVTEMGVIAFALGIDPTFVAAHHLVRIGLAVLLAPLLFKFYCRMLKLPP